MKLASRLAVSLFAVLFAVIGLGFLFAPARLAAAFGLEATGTAGLLTLRADLGGLFLGLAILCGAGAWTSRRAGLVAAATLLAAILAGRVIGCTVDGAFALGLRELAPEAAALGALLLRLRQTREPAAARVASPASRSARLFRIVGTAGIVLVAGAVAALASPAVQQAIFDRGARRQTARTNLAPLVDDALRVAIAGSSAPLPSAARAKASVVVFVGDRFWVVDSGPESVENLVLWGIPLDRVAGVLLTHFHSDHIGDLGELQLQTWAGGRRAPLAVFGGPGVDGVVAGFNQAYALDQGYRTEHHGEQVMPSATWGMVAHTVVLDGAPTPEKDRTGLVYDDGSLRITAIEVDHAPIEPAYAYRFDYKGRSVVITGDLKNHPPLVTSAADADILVSEAISRPMTRSLEEAAHAADRPRTAAIMHDVQDYHISPEEVAHLANEARVGLLVYYHLLPSPDGMLARRLFAQGVDTIRPDDWTIADDGSLYTLPLGSDAIRIGRMEVP